MLITESELITLALYIASIRLDNPDLAGFLEQQLYTIACDYFSESEINYLLELTEYQVFQ